MWLLDAMHLKRSAGSKRGARLFRPFVLVGCYPGNASGPTRMDRRKGNCACHPRSSRGRELANRGDALPGDGKRLVDWLEGNSSRHQYCFSEASAHYPRRFHSTLISVSSRGWRRLPTPITCRYKFYAQPMATLMQAIPGPPSLHIESL